MHVFFLFRYVRELLGSLATAEVIHVSTNEAGSLVYHLEEDEKNVFKTDIMAVIGYINPLTKIYDKIKPCVSRTGPLGNRMTKEFHDALQEFGPYHFDEYMDTLLTRVDGLKSQLERGIDVLDVGCGRGLLLTKIAPMFPKSTFTASDNVQSLVEHLKTTMCQIPNIRFDFVDICSSSSLPSQQYDWINCLHVIHDVPSPPEALQNVKKLLKPIGVLTLVDMAPTGSPLKDRGNLGIACYYAISSFFCVAESYQREDSHAMGLCWGKQKIIELLGSAGFDVEIIDFKYPLAMFICK
ncbi:hypothetical protein BsWGS_10700 [Bradybaena similaris]